MGRFSVFTEVYALEKQKNFGKTTYTGIINGYLTIITIEESRYKRDLYITIGATVDSNKLKQSKENLLDIKRVKHVTIKDHTIEIYANTYARTGKFKEHIQQIIDPLIDDLVQLNVTTGCFLTGINDNTVELMKLKGEYAFVSSVAYEEKHAEFQKIQTDKNAKGNSLIFGLVGAFIGSLIGGLIWGILLYFGYYGWFAAVIGVIVAFYLYRKFGGPINITGAIGILIILISILLLTNRAVYTYILSEIFTEANLVGYSFSDIFMNIEEYLYRLDSIIVQTGESVSFVSAFNLDNWLGIGVAMIFGIGYFIFEYQRFKNQYTIKKLNK